MRRTTTRLWLPVCLTAALLTACTPDDDATSSPADPADAGRSVEEEIAANHDWVDSDLTWDEASATRVTLDGGDVRTDGDGVEVDGTTVTVTAAGTYVLSGTFDDGQVVVDTDDTEQVTLVLDDVSITSGTTSPLQVRAAEEVVVALPEGTQSSLADPVEHADEDDEADAALFSAADLTITGPGALTVAGSSNDAIASNDDLVLHSGRIQVTAADDGLRGKDALVVVDASIGV